MRLAGDYSIETPMRPYCDQDHRHQAFGGITYSQHGEDLMLCNLFHLMKIDRPRYLDVGAHHPYVTSNTALLHERGSRGVNVEANPLLIDAFLNARPDDVTVNVGVGPEEGTFPFYTFSQRGGLNTFSESVATSRKDGRPIERVLRLPVWKLDQVVGEYCDGVYPELLSLDLEGLDLPVLESADFSRSRPVVIVAELREPEASAAKAVLARWGYKAHCRMMANLIFIQEERIGMVI